MLFAPMFHLADGAGSMGTTMAGATHHFVPSFTPDLVISALSEHGITHALMVPTMIGMVLQLADFSADALRDLRYLRDLRAPYWEGKKRLNDIESAW
jgi:non-ribosomal peptide synthetase component E (peptide arylation enzyme)